MPPVTYGRSTAPPDCAAEKYLPGKSDAAWLAGKFHGYLLSRAATESASLPDLLEEITAAVCADFHAEKLSDPPARMNQPAAAALIARLRPGGILETVAIGDCQLFVAQPGKPAKLYCAGRERLGDRAAIERVRAVMKEHNLSWSAALSKLWPSLNEGRNKMNAPGGYAALSIGMPPRDLLVQEAIPLERGARLLLATDGFTRLYEVFGAYTEETLLEAAFEKGLAALLKELRTLEARDAACEKVPRMKPRDDATAILAIAE